MEYLIIAIVSILAVELFLKLPVRQAVDNLWRVSQKASHVVLSPHISDHWKEKVMLVYAKQAFTRTLKLATIILVFVAMVLLPVVIFDYLQLTEQPVLALLSTTKGLIASTIMAIFYFWLRGRFAK